MDTLDWADLNVHWEAAGIPATPTVPVDTVDAAVAAQRTLGGAVWVRGAASAPVAICPVVPNPADLPLAVRQVQKHTGMKTVYVQQPVAGSQFRVVGYRLGGAFHAIEIVRDAVPDGMYRVVMTRSTPPQLGGADYMALLALAKDALRVVPGGDGPAAAIVTLSARGPVLTWVDTQPEADPGDALLLRHALGIDLAAACAIAANGGRPSVSATRDLGVALAYLPTHGGIVTGVTGMAAARALPGVVEVVVYAQPGDLLGHVIDSASRNAGGYVLAVGATAAIALARVEAARAAIEIQVESVRR